MALERKKGSCAAEIVVIGSLNMDIVTRVGRHPAPGETVKGLGTGFSPGGKGANQAAAAAMAGGAVAMIGTVGNDAFREPLLASLAQRGVETGSVLQKEAVSGMASITVDAGGENIIVLTGGANDLLTPADVEQALSGIPGAKYVLLQNEIPRETNAAAIRRGHAAGAKVFYNTAPAMKLEPEYYPYIDTVIANETEAEWITGFPVSNLEEAEQAADWWIGQGARAALVTLGVQGALYKERGGVRIDSPAFRVNPVDTTAAGDTFIGVYAAALAEGHDVRQSLRIASAAAALAVTKPGAQASMPDKAEIAQFLQRFGHSAE
ncbi:ribokinase [Paenibacillus humicola]|uniref:ribokinase n=1 Tax=Paenibacillus humicola TaxID=3110540 RepID=UPI00237A7616|nr:ribokinase [Paenibacillus humicola]